jgi:signal transduction histidine kinase
VDLTKVNILIVDDRAEKRLALSALLSELGENLVLADSGKEALRQVLRADFAVILLDIHMPDMDGFETATLIRARKSSRSTPIIFLTAHTDDLYETRSYELGGVDFMLTPAVPAILKAKVGVFVDLARKTEQVRRQAEEQEANRLKDEFLAVVSHELRSPLNAILGWTRILRTTSIDPARTARGLEVIERNADAQLRLIEDLLDTSRITAGVLSIATRPLALGPIVEVAVDALRPAADAKGVALSASLDGGDGLVDGDADRLQQAVTNLLTNALKFTPKGGRVEARLARRDTFFELEIRDTGDGIDPSFLPYVFDRFRQAQTSTRRQGGLGLGLGIVRHVVELHGGSVRAESAGRNQGSTFLVRLPALPRLPAHASNGVPEEG